MTPLIRGVRSPPNVISRSSSPRRRPRPAKASSAQSGICRVQRPAWATQISLKGLDAPAVGQEVLLFPQEDARENDSSTAFGRLPIAALQAAGGYPKNANRAPITITQTTTVVKLKPPFSSGGVPGGLRRSLARSFAAFSFLQYGQNPSMNGPCLGHVLLWGCGSAKDIPSCRAYLNRYELAFN